MIHRCNKIARVPRLIKCKDSNAKIDDHAKRCICIECLCPYDMKKRCPFYGHEQHALVETLELSGMKKNRYGKLELTCEYKFKKNKK